ncbi:hypothetical protein ES703_82419 [subsurface metagenome]
MRYIKKALVIIGIQSAFAVGLSVIDVFTLTEPIASPMVNLHPLSRFLFLIDGYFICFLLGLIPFGLVYLLTRVRGLRFIFRGGVVRSLVAFNIVLSILVYLIVPIDRILPSQRSVLGVLLTILILMLLLVGYVVMVIFVGWVAGRLGGRLKVVLGSVIIILGLFMVATGYGVRVAYELGPLWRGDDLSPNVIIISIDTLRKDHLSCYGYEGCKTPNIDGFAEKSVVFENCIAPSPHTVPSMASLLTGVYPMVHGCRFIPSTPINDDIQTLSQILKLYGYHTELYTANPILDINRGFNRGFDYYESCYFTGNLGYHLPQRVYDVVKRVLFFDGVDAREIYYYTTEWLRGKVASRLERLDNCSPFFLWFHFLDPHAAYTPPQGFIPAKEDEQRRLSSIKFKLEEDEYPRSEVSDIVKLYDGEIQYVDDALGDLLGRMEGLGLFDDTIIILTADHGEEFWEHDGFGHGHCLYPEVVRIPLMIYLPPSLGNACGHIYDYVSLVDIAPTILDYLGLPSSKGMGGKSLSALMESINKHHSLDDGGLSSYLIFNELAQYPNKPSVQKSIYEGNYHLIYDFTSEEKKLYGLEGDLGELVDISAEDEDTTERLYAELMEWYETNLQIVEELAPQKEMEMSEEEKEMMRGMGYIIGVGE